MKLTILSFLILFFLSNTAVSEDITYTEGDFSYYMTNEGAVLVDWENSGEKLPLSTLIVPNTLGGKPVIGIGSGTFASSQSEPITDPLEIVIPEGVVFLEDDAFTDCCEASPSFAYHPLWKQFPKEVCFMSKRRLHSLKAIRFMS